MKASVLLTILIPFALMADGGSVILQLKTASNSVTLFASPAAPSEGVSDFSVLVQDRQTSKAVLDADVDLTVCGSPFRATRANARNKLLYAASVDLSRGSCEISVTLTLKGHRDSMSGAINVAKGVDRTDGWFQYVIPAPLGVLVFALHQHLRNRQGSGSVLSLVNKS